MVMKKRSLKSLKKVIVHCSDTDDASADDIDIIRKWHMLRGFDDVGYHFFIDKKGSIHRGRDIDLAGAHCKGHNSDSIGVCVSGKEDFTQDQFIALGMMLQVLFFEYGDLPVYQHKEFNKNKTCPNFDSVVFDKITKPLQAIGSQEN